MWGIGWFSLSNDTGCSQKNNDLGHPIGWIEPNGFFWYLAVFPEMPRPYPTPRFSSKFCFFWSTRLPHTKIAACLSMLYSPNPVKKQARIPISLNMETWKRCWETEIPDSLHLQQRSNFGNPEFIWKFHVHHKIPIGSGSPMSNFCFPFFWSKPSVDLVEIQSGSCDEQHNANTDDAIGQIQHWYLAVFGLRSSHTGLNNRSLTAKCSMTQSKTWM